MAVEPAVLSFDACGAPASARYGDVYASRDGALGQARHVFLGGTRCAERWRGRDHFTILETGFGLGVNFLAAWQAWRDDDARPRRLHFVSVERHPLPAAALVEAAPVELRALAIELAARWPLPIAGLHRVQFDDGAVILTIALGDARDVTPQLVVGADAVFLDGFAPDRNPQMWEPPLLRAVARLARRDCRLATWTTARDVRDALAHAGFELEFAPGFGHKRQMLLGRYAPRYARRRHDPPSTYAGDRSALVIGAGLAGAACAQALASRGWSVVVLDGAPPAQGASALPWGLMHPHFAADDNRLARLTRAGSLCTATTLARVAPGGVHAGRSAWQPSGVFQRASDPAEARRWHAAIEAQRMPAGWVQRLEAASAAAMLGMAPAEAGLWWPTAMVASPARIVAALLDHPRIRVVRSAVGSLRAEDGTWVVSTVDGAALASAAIAIVGTALDAPRLLQAARLPVRAVGGQVTFIESRPLRALRAGLGGDGTVLRAPDGTVVVGSTYEAADSGVPLLLDEDSAARSNLARLQRLLAQPVEARVIGSFAGVRCAARDRLPYVGQVADEAAAAAGATALRGAHFDDLPRRPRLYAAFALGSRGLTFAPLAGELIAARIEGEPLPIERDLAGALDPARVLLHRLRRGLPPLHGVAAGC